MNFGDKLKQIRITRNMSQDDFATLLGTSKQVISRYENNLRTPKLTVAKKFSDILNVPLEFLVDNNVQTVENATTNPHFYIPVLGYVRAGIPIEAVEDILDYEEISKEMASSGEHFGLKIVGDSMEPRIQQGDVVIVRKQEDVDSGQIAVVLVNGSNATVKKIIKQSNGISLVAFNSYYDPKFYSDDEITSLPVSIIGRVVELRGKF